MHFGFKVYEGMKIKSPTKMSWLGQRRVVAAKDEVNKKKMNAALCDTLENQEEILWS